ncbi:hypothetical protein D9M68_515760 [compost metagenome]
MNTTVKFPVALICIFTWIGFVCAISFMEAWLKFRAPGITVPLGLGIGRLVFAALNKVEWVFAIITGFTVVKNHKYISLSIKLALLSVSMILLLQTFWLLPALDHRAILLLRGEKIFASSHHIWYIIAEILKVIGLFIAGCSFFKRDLRINL